MVVVCRAAIDDDVRSASLRSDEWKGSGGINRQGRAQRHHEIGFHRCLARAFEFFRVKVLAEADSGRFQESATLTEWWLALESEVIEVRLRIAARVTGLTLDQRICAVEFYQAFCTRAGEAMQAVDVLRDNRAESTGLFQADDRMMNRVRPGVAEGISPFELVIPMRDSRRFRGHEILEIDRLSPGPYTLRSTEIRNAAAR